MKKAFYKMISAVVFIAAMILLVKILIPLITSYNNPAGFDAYIRDLGMWGNVAMFFIQVAQIIVALVPGEVVEFVAGTLYGWLGGLLFCLAGITVGQSLIFISVRFLGKNFVEKVAGSKAITKFSFLQDEKKLKSIIFLLFFIPGTPKDLLTYAVPFTRINLKEFLVISLVARIPSVLSSTFAGSAFAGRDFVTLAIAYSVIFLFSVIGLITYKKWEEKHRR